MTPVHTLLEVSSLEACETDIYLESVATLSFLTGQSDFDLKWIHGTALLVRVEQNVSFSESGRDGVFTSWWACSQSV